MAKLTLSFKGTPLKEFPVDADEMIIGSDPRCDIHIDSLAVNAFHARVRVGTQGITIEDMETKAGISVNGRKVNRTLLKHGDIILVGKHALTLEDYEALRAALTGAEQADAEQEPVDKFEPVQTEIVDEAGTPTSPQVMTETTADFIVQASAQPVAEHPAESVAEVAAEPAMENAAEILPPAEETIAADSGMPEGTPAETEAEDREDDATQKKVSGWLQILSGSAMGRTIKLKRSLTDLGKMGLPAALISKRQDGYHIANLDDASPLLVNDADIGKDSYLLPDGAIISLGNTRMQFYLQAD